MIIVGVTWGNRVYMEMVCDCKNCMEHKYKHKMVCTGDSFEECVDAAKESGWLIKRVESRCYCKGHFKYSRKI